MRVLSLLFFCVCANAVSAAERSGLMPEPNSLFLRVIDTGSGAATLTIVTGASTDERHVMIYDGGHWDDDPWIIDELTHYLGLGSAIEFLIISHTDSDHLGAADSILEFWKVEKSVRNGWERDDGVGTYWNYREALATSVANNGTEDHLIDDGDPALGDTWPLGDATVTFLSGFGELPDGWDVGVQPSNSRYESKARNAVSIVVRLDYGDKSILYTGDAVGRLDEDPWSRVLGTEKFLLENNTARPLQADILMAPHHGADNASSLPFIEAVTPAWVIFSAGNLHAHPKFNTFKRYEASDVAVANILRTDRGDEKGRETEWWGDWADSCRDKHGDDGISILIREIGEIVVEQDRVVSVSNGC